jgi:hypothetical protein
MAWYWPSELNALREEEESCDFLTFKDPGSDQMKISALTATCSWRSAVTLTCVRCADMTPAGVGRGDASD